MSLPTAIGYLTVFRLPGKRTFDLRRAVVWFPLVGLAMGALLALEWTLLLQIAPRAIATVLVLLTWVWMTGGLHLDGLADTSDALLSWRNRENMFEVMKSPDVGAIGVLSLICLLATKGVALFNLGSDQRAAAALLCAPLFGRSAQVLATVFSRYAKEDGVAVTAFDPPRRWPRIVVALIPLGVSLQLGWQSALILMTGFLLLVALLLRRITKLLGGMTGDTLGALTEIVEAWVLVGATFVLPRWPWF